MADSHEHEVLETQMSAMNSVVRGQRSGLCDFTKPIFGPNSRTLTIVAKDFYTNV